MKISIFVKKEAIMKLLLSVIKISQEVIKILFFIKKKQNFKKNKEKKVLTNILNVWILLGKRLDWQVGVKMSWVKD